MSGSDRLAEAFLTHLPEPARSELARSPELEQTLRRLIDAGKAAWPALAVQPDDFLSHVARHLPPPGSVQSLERLRAADLYLACACARATPGALEAFDAAYVAEVDAMFRRRDLRALAAEVKQALRNKLLVSEPGRPAKIAEYAGRTDLRTWLKVCASRVVVDLRRAGVSPGAPGDSGVAALRAAGDDPELMHVKNRYRDELRLSLEDAVTALSPRQRNLLRQHHADGLTMDQLASLYRVHRVTMSRWVGEAREALASETRRTLLQRFGIGRRDLESILRILYSNVEFSVRALLATDGSDGTHRRGEDRSRDVPHG